MIHKGAIAILSTMLTGLLAWGGTTLFNHESRISKNETIHERLHRIESKQDKMLEIISGQ